VQGSDGYFYCTTFTGGTSGNGCVFKISASGAFTSLYSFTGGADGANPLAGLFQGSDGSFYGTTIQGGMYYYGTVFKISASGAFTNLYSFTGGADGANPAGGLVQGSDGNFYGTTSRGGNGYGTVFNISASGALTSLYGFTGGNDGEHPLAGLVQGSDGYFYGTTIQGTNDGLGGNGTVFKISASGWFTNLYGFPASNDGAVPEAALVQGSDGYFYGTTSQGGTSGNNGTVFKISPSGSFTRLYSFSGGKDGGSPNGLVQGSDGYFYGTTFTGGTSGNGGVFKISASGAFTSLYSFTGGADGGAGWRPGSKVDG